MSYFGFDGGFKSAFAWSRVCPPFLLIFSIDSRIAYNPRLKFTLNCLVGRWSNLFRYLTNVIYNCLPLRDWDLWIGVVRQCTSWSGGSAGLISDQLSLSLVWMDRSRRTLSFRGSWTFMTRERKITLKDSFHGWISSSKDKGHTDETFNGFPVHVTSGKIRAIQQKAKGKGEMRVLDRKF